MFLFQISEFFFDLLLKLQKMDFGWRVLKSKCFLYLKLTLLTLICLHQLPLFDTIKATIKDVLN